ncbi:hypothetical protein ALC62_01008 [Cyphomyrmex costatus]|uniref:Uncharacterized protein n=1 Tax=Cyphomyrmex costatus TaxID=456900 RepID=A0A151IPU1_9HYME|nr:hypothetical protein ALC62_01008 [Cyphomyrmex costatus]
MDIDELPKLARKRQIRDTIEGEPARIIEESPAKRVPSACASASSSDTAIGTIRNTQTQVSGVTNTGGSARQHNLTIGQRISPRYSVRDPGPFVVYVYPINRDNAIHPTLINGIDSGDTYQTYAGVLGSRSHPHSNKINNSSNISRDHVLPHFSKQRPARSTVSAGPGYDARAHQQVLHEINGKIPYSSGNGVAFQKTPSLRGRALAQITVRNLALALISQACFL